MTLTAKKPETIGKTALCKALERYGLHEPAFLARALGVSRQNAYMILTGKRSPASNRPYHIGTKVAKRIAEATAQIDVQKRGLHWTVILELQEDGKP